MSDILQEDIFLPIPNSEEVLYLKRFNPSIENSEPVFCLHGSIENGRIYYSKEGDKGFAPFMAKQGYDVFVVDLRGKGKSTPKISSASNHGQREVILEDIPLISNHIKKIKGNAPQIWASHSWGGNLMNASFARLQNANVKAMVHFATKRRITVWNWSRLKMIQFGWFFLGKRWLKKLGYLPFKEKGYGGDNEPKNFYLQINQWIGSNEMKDTVDGFDYFEAFEKCDMPPTLWLAGTNDPVLGYHKDVYNTMEETCNANAKFELLGKANGYQKDYGHNNMLTDKLAAKEVFPMIKEWLDKL